MSLPELPKGQFWRVVEYPEGTRDLIQLRKKLWIGSRLLWRKRIENTSDYPPSALAVQNAAHYVFRDYVSYREDRKIYGNYPPKKLK